MRPQENLAFLRKHLWIALGLAFVFRALTAYFNYGPQSVDDYDHGLIPAWELLRGIPLNLPEWRSPLLVWTLYPFAKLASLVGLTVSFDIFRVIMLALGVFSLWGIWSFGGYLARNPSFALTTDRLGAPTPLEAERRRLWLVPLYLLSVHFILSFAVTRAFGEVIAATLVLIAVLWMEESLDHMDKGRARLRFFVGASLLGIACLYRYQVGVLGIGMAGYLLATRRFREFGWLAAGGLVALLLEGGKDLLFGRTFLETLLAYLNVNKNGAIEWSNQPWYNTWTTVMLMFFLPFSAPFFIGLKKTIRFERVVWILILLFTAIHSMIPHKEERFLYPILPLTLVLLGRLWARAWGTKFEKFFFRPFIGLIMIAGLAVATISNSQSGEYEPLLRAARLSGAARLPGSVLIWDNESLLEKSFFRERLVVAPVEYQIHPGLPAIEDLERLRQRGQSLLVVTSNEEKLPAFREWRAGIPAGLDCGELDRIQSIGDRMLYRSNPKYNTRRKPTWIYQCFWPSDAADEH
ncbi:MAG: hypothetical protein KF767_07495 [Bdellovibrionaceae bacterium]|nr:hypothetical protein [Pseudobdellovibrionaceae bacterium]